MMKLETLEHVESNFVCENVSLVFNLIIGAAFINNLRGVSECIL